MSKSRFIKIKTILTSKNISVALRLRLVTCYIYSIFLYGCETWTLNKTLEKKIDAFEMWIFRRIGRISWTQRMTNEDVCKKLNIRPTLLTTIQSRKIRYFGHITRHEGIQKDILFGRIEGKRARGRQCLTWTDEIKAWTGKTMTECTREADNRERWRSISSRPRKR